MNLRSNKFILASLLLTTSLASAGHKDIGLTSTTSVKQPAVERDAFESQRLSAVKPFHTYFVLKNLSPVLHRFQYWFRSGNDQRPLSADEAQLQGEYCFIDFQVKDQADFTRQLTEKMRIGQELSKNSDSRGLKSKFYCGAHWDSWNMPHPSIPEERTPLPSSLTEVSAQLSSAMPVLFPKMSEERIHYLGCHGKATLIETITGSPYDEREQLISDWQIELPIVFDSNYKVTSHEVYGWGRTSRFSLKNDHDRYVNYRVPARWEGHSLTLSEMKKTPLQNRKAPRSLIETEMSKLFTEIGKTLRQDAVGSYSNPHLDLSTNSGNRSDETVSEIAPYEQSISLTLHISVFKRVQDNYLAEGSQEIIFSFPMKKFFDESPNAVTESSIEFPGLETSLKLTLTPSKKTVMFTLISQDGKMESRTYSYSSFETPILKLPGGVEYMKDKYLRMACLDSGNEMISHSSHQHKIEVLGGYYGLSVQTDVRLGIAD